MKIRNGFVSNSSSSSFLIGVAKIKNLKKVESIIKDYYYDFKIEEFKGDYISVESFRGDELSIGNDKLDIGDKVLIIDYCGYEGDDYFMVNDDDMDYYIDINDINPHFISIINKIGKYVEHLDFICGAGRNG
jgi:hypothetical protein